MFRIIGCLLLIFCLFPTEINAQEKAKKINYEKEGYVKALVINYKVDGCGFLIELTDKAKTKLMPEKLSDELKKDKQKIWLKYAPVKKQPMSTCMAGKYIEVTDIQKRK
jgi:hypothetical protein